MRCETVCVSHHAHVSQHTWRGLHNRAAVLQAAYYGAHGHHADDRPGGPNGGHDGTPNLDMAFAMHPPHARPGHHHTPRPSTASKLVPSVSELQQCDTLEKLQSVFHLPINDAAASLGMGVTVLKKLCRDREIKRWPFRKLSSVDKLIESVKKVRRRACIAVRACFRNAVHCPGRLCTTAL